jgi:hypothetical protein
MGSGDGRESIEHTPSECLSQHSAPPSDHIQELLFSEAGGPWQPLPEWARSLIRFGYEWPAAESRPRRIALISMPCDSAAAGLVALGAMIRDLGSPDAHDTATHFEGLTRFARQYLQDCKGCQVRCEPASKGCGHISQASGQLRHRDAGRYEVSRIETGGRWGDAIACTSNRETRLVLQRYAADWYIDGQAPVHAGTDASGLDRDAYRHVVPNAPILVTNSRYSFSGLCLAGRATGDTATKEVCASIRFRINETTHALSGMLLVQNWGDSRRISRLSFFNIRTERFDRNVVAPSLVIADGDASFLSVLRRKELQYADVIGVTHRAMDRDHLEAVGRRLAGLQQWYAEDTESMQRVGALHRGISVSILRQRHTG